MPANDEALEKHRATLRAKPDDMNAWISIGNRHVMKAEEGLAEIFYLHVLQKNPKHAGAVNNLAYLRGREGDLARGDGEGGRGRACGEVARPGVDWH
jgi:hypothetical protein